MDELHTTEEYEIDKEPLATETTDDNFYAAEPFENPLPPHNTDKKKIRLPRRYGVGMLTAPLTLITVGLTLLISLIAGGSPMNAVKVLPLGLVFLGLEILLNLFLRRSGKIILEPHSLLLTAGIAFVVLCLSVPFISGEAGENSEAENLRAEVEESLSAQARSSFRRALSGSENAAYVKDVHVDVTIKGMDKSAYSALSDLSGDDEIDVTVIIRETPVTTEEFALICRSIIPAVKEAGLPINKLMFICDDIFDRMSLTLDGTFELELTEAEIEKLVGYADVSPSADWEDEADLEDS